MARRKTNRKKADETLVDIVEVKDQAQGFVEENQRLIFGLGIGLILLVGGYFFYHNLYKAPREKEAMEQMFKAQEQFERDSFALALTNPGGGYVGFLDIIDSYGGTKAANLANYYAGVAYLNLGQFDASLDYMKSFSPDGKIGPVMKHGVLGDIYSELNQMDNAISSYKKAISGGENEVLTAYYLKKLGMLYEKNGNLADAKSSYQKVKSAYPESPYATDIDKYITRVTGQQ
ncbi:MAG: tetratricopeptide repeat protein [Saprospiraceae bacterium]